MREAINFTFDGISSEDMGVIIASPTGGLYDEFFLPRRSIVEVKIPKKHIPYHQRMELEPISFSLTIFIEEWDERDNLRQIARWLFQDFYKPLVFETNPDRIFYAMFHGDSRLKHNGAKQGYIELDVRCNSPFTYSRTQEVETLEVRATNINNLLSIFNEGDMSIKPRAWITKRVAGGSITITNESNEQLITIDNLLLDEEVFIDFENVEIISSLETSDVYHYDNHNGIWLELIEGDNSLSFIGDFDIRFEFERVYFAD